MEAKRETLATFGEGAAMRSNVTKIVNGDKVNYLTQSNSFESETNSLGAVALAGYHSDTKHVLFLFDEKGNEVKRYYIGKNLQALNDDELIEKRHSLVFFESWNPAKSQWVPCVGLGQPSIASRAKAW